nr:MAG TPA: excisionase [Caudoviricetes sp.]
MTVSEIQAANKPYLTPVEVAEVLECDPQAIRLAARDNPGQLGFPVVRVGKRTKIPRIPFLRFLGYA